MAEEEYEIDSKLKALEHELDEMKRRTNSLLSSTDAPVPYPTNSYSNPPINHADLVSQLLHRTPAVESVSRQQMYQPKVSVPVLDVGYSTQAALRHADHYKPDYKLSNGEAPLVRLELEQAERRVAELSQQTDIERSFCNSERIKRERLEVDCIELKRKVVDLDKELALVKAGADREINDLRSQVRQSSMNVQSLEDALTSAKSEVSRDSIVRKQLETQLSVYHSQKSELEKRGSFLEQTIRDLHTNVEDLSHRMAGLGEEKDALERKLRQQLATNESVAEVDRMRQEAETSALKLRSQLVDLQRQRKDDSNEIQKLFSDNDLAKKEINKLTEENYNLSLENEKTRSQLLNANGENKQLKIITDKQRVELRRLADQISALQADNRSLVKAQHDSLIAAVSADLNQLSPRYNPAPVQLSSPVIMSPQQTYSIPYDPVPHQKPRQPMPPPWAVNFDSPNARELRSDGVGAAMIGLTQEDQELERELLELNQERAAIEGWLGRLPLNSGGRTMSERKEKQAKEYRLSCVDARIGQIKSSLRRRKLI